MGVSTLRRFLVFIALLLVVLAVAGCGGTQTQKVPAEEKASASGGESVEALTVQGVAADVSVKGIWLTPSLLSGDQELAKMIPESSAAVLLMFTTHSGDLSTVDLRMATLDLASGSVRPTEVLNLSPDAHHREDLLVFEGVDYRQRGEVTLEIPGVRDGQTARLQWSLGG